MGEGNVTPLQYSCVENPMDVCSNFIFFLANPGPQDISDMSKVRT